MLIAVIQTKYTNPDESQYIVAGMEEEMTFAHKKFRYRFR